MPLGKDTPEHAALKVKARAMGIRFGPRLSQPKLQALIDAHNRGEEVPMIGAPKAVPEPPVQPIAQPVATAPALTPQQVAVAAGGTSVNGNKLYMTHAEFRKKQVAENKQKVNRLVRCRITCMNPHKKNWTGEIVSVGSAKLGTFKKFIPYNSDEPYHIPWIIFQHMKEKQCRIGTTQRLPNGQEVNRYKLINEYAIEVLDPLTSVELKDLAQRQAMAAGTT